MNVFINGQLLLLLTVNSLINGKYLSLTVNNPIDDKCFY